jgi:DMSO reductase family type II enzyme heme b subunit
LKGQFVTRTSRSIVTFTVPLLLMGAVYFVVMRGMSQPREVVPAGNEPLMVTQTTATLPAEPDADQWSDIEPVKIRLFPQAARMPYGTEERDLWVRGVYNDREVAFLLEFRDETEDLGDPSTPDACAILLTDARSPATTQMMGHGSNANIWHWMADRDQARYRYDTDSAASAVRELIALGPGTQTLLPSQTVLGRGHYRNGTWRVVFKRQRESQQPGELALTPGNGVDVSFAVWDGASAESMSRKSIAVLRALTLEQG